MSDRRDVPAATSTVPSSPVARSAQTRTRRRGDARIGVDGVAPGFQQDRAAEAVRVGRHRRDEVDGGLDSFRSRPPPGPTTIRAGTSGSANPAAAIPGVREVDDAVAVGVGGVERDGRPRPRARRRPAAASAVEPGACEQGETAPATMDSGGDGRARPHVPARVGSGCRRREAVMEGWGGTKGWGRSGLLPAPATGGEPRT